MINRRDTVLVRLLFASCKLLSERGLHGAFVDSINSNERGLEMLGEWIKAAAAVLASERRSADLNS